MHRRLNTRWVVCCACAASLAVTFGARAATIYSDGFETYQLGAIDMNLTGGTNASANGTGTNPWFGPAPPNMNVVNAEGAVTPHSGTKMIRGTGNPSDFDQDWLNIAHRFNNGSPFTGNLQYDWWFYDPNGATNGSAFRDFSSIGYYDTAPGATDYPGTGSLNSGVSVVERLCAGASSDTNGTYNAGVYQVRVVGMAGGYDGSTGWFNTTVARTVGWHHAEIVIGPRAADTSNPVTFYIDNLATPVLTGTTVVNAGYNILEMNGDFGTATGYFDDVSLATLPVPEPAGLSLLALGGLVAIRRRRR